MTRLWLRYEFRAPPFGTPTNVQYATAMEQVEWADARGFETVFVPEHHGSDGGFCPSPFVALAGLAGRSRRIRLQVCASILPLHDPVRVAEDAVVLDNLCGGRLELVVAPGWVPSEFAMFGVSLGQRASRLEEGIAVLRAAFNGEPFRMHERQGAVTPGPARVGGPPLFIGGALPRSARRAARLGDGFFPTVCSEDIVEIYREECVALGKAPGRVFDNRGPLFTHVTEDPERAWAELAPYLLYETNAYARWAAEASAAAADASIPMEEAHDVDALQSTGVYRVVTPEQCIELARELDGTDRMLVFSPLAGGIAPEVAWKSLELFADKVLPHITVDQPTSAVTSP